MGHLRVTRHSIQASLLDNDSRLYEIEPGDRFEYTAWFVKDNSVLSYP